VAQHGGGPAGHHGGEVAAVAAQDRVADGVNAAVERMKPAGPYSPADRLAIEAEVQQLPPADDAVLTRGEIGEPPVWGCLYTHIVY
jgi:hypothetical protein